MNQLLRYSYLAIVLTALASCGGKTIGTVPTDKRTPARVENQRPAPPTRVENLRPRPTPQSPLAETTRDNPLCPAEVDAPTILPGVEPRHLRLAYWLERLGKLYDLDEPLLTAAQVRDLNAGNSFTRKGYHPQLDLLERPDPKEYADYVKGRIGWVLSKLVAGEYVAPNGDRASAPQLALLRQPVSLDVLQPTLHVALGDVPLRCIPLSASFHSTDPQTKKVSTRYDRNACSTAHAQEVLQVLRRWPNGMRLVRTRYALGWITADAPLSPPIAPEHHRALIAAPRLQLVGTDTVELEDGQRVRLRDGILLPPASKKRHERRVLVATASGLHVSKPLDADKLRTTARTLTRRSLLTEAWRYFDTPYGLGGVGNGRDCSRLLLDLFESFDIKLPRFSGWQALSGSFTIDVSKASESERLMLIDSAAKRGIVLLHFPGHIMMYLGRDDRGKPLVFHAFGEYLKPCPRRASTGNKRPGETLLRVKKVTVSDLELGRGTSRKSFIERLTRVIVIGKTAGRALAGVAELRPTAKIVIPKRRCRDGYHNAIWISPRRPHAGAALRVIASLSRDPGPVSMVLVDPRGKRHTPKLVRLGGPPYGLVATVDKPTPGHWRAVVGDGQHIVACQGFSVAARQSVVRSDPTGPIWQPTRRWSVATENLYALFVERLFDDPAGKDKTWPNLHTLLQDPARNLLYNHLNLDEDPKIRLVPDCADLPVALRTYFAWKMRLPFGYFACRRADRQKPPKCDLPGSDDNLMSRLELKSHPIKSSTSRRDVHAFLAFAYKVMGAIHSSSGRTQPDDEESDLYPVPLTRRALRPGTVFVDPFGHVLMIAKWVPQGIGTQYGMLIGVDAQPDGTIGRRRFWRGSFLFRPETSAGGSGFKAWRPDYVKKGEVTIEVDDKGTKKQVTRIGRVLTWTNRGLRYTKAFTKLSRQQYEGTKNDFYDTVESLINPLPLDPIVRQLALVDALEEMLRRRVVALDNGEAYLKKTSGQLIKLPHGASIFLSSIQAWEAYSTPSRDIRLLIAIDSVLGFPDEIKRGPQRFGLSRGDDVDAVIRKVRARLAEELHKRTIHYTRTDGSKWTLSLQQIIERQKSLEMAYNPNDCVEIRWGAPEGSDERKTCKRQAPTEQRQRMETYRHWFHTRQRPPN